MAPQLMQSNPLVRENAGRVAVERGPLVYCIEQWDQPQLRSIFDASLVLDRAHAFKSEFRHEFKSEFRKHTLGGVLVLKHAGEVSDTPLSTEPLYERFGAGRGTQHTTPIELTLVPYYTWANRGPASMEVWIPFRAPNGLPARTQ